MVVSRRETALQAPARLLASMSDVVATFVAPGGRSKAAAASGDSNSSHNSSALAHSHSTSVPLSPTRPAASSALHSEALTGATHASAAASVALQDSGTAVEAAKALGRRQRPLTQLMRRYHRCVTAALWDVRGTRQLLRRAGRVAAAETRAPPRHWVERMVKNCDTVVRCGRASVSMRIRAVACSGWSAESSLEYWELAYGVGLRSS